jgi:hypothetical protein
MMTQMIPHNTSSRSFRKSRPHMAQAAGAGIDFSAADLGPGEINPIQWHQAIGYARTQCARIFRDGGAPADALKAFSLKSSSDTTADWSHAVQRIAMHLCAPSS